MLNNTLKVYGEDLATVNFADIPSTYYYGDVVPLGNTQGALVVNIFAVGDWDITSNLSIVLQHSDEKDGVFETLYTQAYHDGQKATDGELVDTMVLFAKAKKYARIKVINNQNTVGGVKVSFGYLPR